MTSLNLIGYVQGMSDLLAPIMVIMENEVDSFWCFSGYMDKIVPNYWIIQKKKNKILNMIINLKGIKFFNGTIRNKATAVQPKSAFRIHWLEILAVSWKKRIVKHVFLFQMDSYFIQKRI